MSYIFISHFNLLTLYTKCFSNYFLIAWQRNPRISRDHEFAWLSVSFYTFSCDKGCLSAGQVGDGRLNKENVKRKS